MSTTTSLLAVDTSAVAVLWLTISVVTLAELILLGQTFLMCTAIRLGSAVAGVLCFVVAIMDVLIAYGIPAEISYSVFDVISSVIYFDVIVAVFLNVGRAYHRFGCERTKVYWVVCMMGMAFTFGNVVVVPLRAEYDFSDAQAAGMLRIFPVVVGVVITLIAFAYALVPLVKVIKTKEYGDTDAYAREFWNFTTVAPLHFLYVIFLFTFIATPIPRNFIILRNLNLLLRMFPLLATSLLPYPPTLQYFKRRFFPNQSIGADLLTSVLGAAPSKRPRNDEFFDIIIADGDLAAQPTPMTKLYKSSTAQQTFTVHPMLTSILPPPRSQKPRTLVQSPNRVLRKPLSFSENALPVSPSRSSTASSRSSLSLPSPTAQSISRSPSRALQPANSLSLSARGSLRLPASESLSLSNRTSLRSSNSESLPQRNLLTLSWFSYQPSRFSAYKLPQYRWTPLNLDEIVPIRLGE